MYEYLHVLMMEEQYGTIRDLTSTTNITDQTIHLLSSKYGTKVVCQFLNYSTVKERKRMMKSCKGYSKSALFHKDAYLVWIRFVQCIDDTVVLYKNILQELLSYSNTTTTTTASVDTSATPSTSTKNTNTYLSISKSKDIVHSKDPSSSSKHEERPILLDMALSDTASKFLLVLLIPTTSTTTSNETTSSTSTTTSTTTTNASHHPGSSVSYTKIFNPNEIDVLSPFHPYIMEKVSPTHTDRHDHHDDPNTTTRTTKNGIPVQKVYTSKKDSEVRRHEILQYFHIPLLQQLCTSNEAYVLKLLQSIPGSNVLYHLYIATIQAVTVPDHTNASHDPVSKKSNHPQRPDQLRELLNEMIRMICKVCRSNLTLSSTSSETDGMDHGDDKENVFEHVVGHRVIKNFILYDASVNALRSSSSSTTTTTSSPSDIPSFTEIFVQEFASEFESMITYNRGAFIVVALLQVPSVGKRVLEHLNTTDLLVVVPPSSSLEVPHEKTKTSTAGLHALRQEIKKLV